MRINRSAIYVGALAALVVLIPNAPSLEAAPAPTRTVVLTCDQGWRGTAVGQYGGVGFEVSCNNGNAREKIEGFSGGAYTVRVGVESSSIGADCFYSGNAPTVLANCIGVRLSIR